MTNQYIFMVEMQYILFLLNWFGHCFLLEFENLKWKSGLRMEIQNESNTSYKYYCPEVFATPILVMDS